MGKFDDTYRFALVNRFLSKALQRLRLGSVADHLTIYLSCSYQNAVRALVSKVLRNEHNFHMSNKTVWNKKRHKDLTKCEILIRIFKNVQMSNMIANRC